MHVTVMERFELPTERAAQHVSTVSSWTPSAGMRATTRAPGATRSTPPVGDEPVDGWDPEATVPPPASYASLVGIGAAAGTAAAAGIAVVVGWSGAPLTFAALVGLDVGVLAGAGVGSLMARRRGRRGASELPEQAPARTEG